MNVPPPWPVSAVFFDAEGTLFRVRGSVAEVYRRYAAQFGLRAAEEAAVAGPLGRAFLEAFQSMQPMAFARKDRSELFELEKEWWKTVARHALAGLGPFPRFEEFFEVLFEAFRSPGAWILEPDCKEVLLGLRARGKRLGIISNFDSRLEDLLEGFGIRHHFQVTVYASRCAAAKPEPAIFEQAAREMKVAAPNALHVGDDLEEDFQAARRAGFQALLYNPSGRRPEAPQDLRIGSLTEISRYLV